MSSYWKCLLTSMNKILFVKTVIMLKKRCLSIHRLCWLEMCLLLYSTFENSTTVVRVRLQIIGIIRLRDILTITNDSFLLEVAFSDHFLDVSTFLYSFAFSICRLQFSSLSIAVHTFVFDVRFRFHPMSRYLCIRWWFISLNEFIMKHNIYLTVVESLSTMIH
jgi:hypothetical protein